MEKNVINVGQGGFFETPMKEITFQDNWKKPIDYFIISSVRLFPRQRIECIYIRGSIAAGNAIEYQSDMDVVLIVNYRMHSSFVKNVNETLEVEIRKKFRHVKSLDLIVLNLEDLIKQKLCIQIQFILKYFAVKVYGESIEQKIPNFKSSRQLLLSLHGSIERDIRKAIKILGETNISSKDHVYEWILKRILRAGAGLTMFSEKAYSRDLNYSIRMIEKYFPEQNVLSQLALNMLKTRSFSQQQIMRIMRGPGEYFASKYRTLVT